MPYDFTVCDVIPATAEEIYDAWLDSAGHEQITGGKSASVTPIRGAEFTVWNGFITGRNLELDRPRRIVQSWRTTRFTEADADSQIEVLLEPVLVLGGRDQVDGVGPAQRSRQAGGIVEATGVGHDLRARHLG